MVNEPLYSLRQVSELTDTNLETVRSWVRDDRIAVERVGPLRLKRVRVRHSVLIALFPHLEISVGLSRSV